MDYLRSLWKREEQLRTKQELMMQKELVLLRSGYTLAKDKRSERNKQEDERQEQSPAHRQCGKTKRERSNVGNMPQIGLTLVIE